MKTEQELLDFYGVEIGKRYHTDNPLDKLYIFKVVKSINGDLCIVSEDGATARPITWLNIITYEEIPPSILDDEEKEYLQTYVMDNPAFKGKVHSIWKCISGEYEYLRILTKNSNDFAIYLPRFIKNSMYKNMRPFVSYTPQDLGLEE